MSRAQLQIVDVVLTFIVLVAALVTAPFMYQFIGMVTSEADPFTTVVLQLVPPLIIVGLIISVGVSARSRGV
jgi:hypothetical protein